MDDSSSRCYRRREPAAAAISFSAKITMKKLTAPSHIHINTLVSTLSEWKLPRMPECVLEAVVVKAEQTNS